MSNPAHRYLKGVLIMSVQVNVNELFLALIAKEMVACGETRQIVPSVNRWEIESMLFVGGNKETAKAAITKFLQEGWRAPAISIFAKHQARARQFLWSFPPASSHHT